MRHERVAVILLFQDNYIKPTEIKSSLSKKSSLRKVKTKEQRVVTFASEERGEGRALQRSRSVHVSSHSPGPLQS